MSATRLMQASCVPCSSRAASLPRRCADGFTSPTEMMRQPLRKASAPRPCARSLSDLSLIYCAGGMTAQIRPPFRHVEPLCSSKSTKSGLALTLGSLRSIKSDKLLGAGRVGAGVLMGAALVGNGRVPRVPGKASVRRCRRRIASCQRRMIAETTVEHLDPEGRAQRRIGNDQDYSGVDLIVQNAC